MKIAVTAKSPNPSGPIDSVFGRAQNFLIFDTDQNEWSCYPNVQNLEAAQGAGIQAAQQIQKLGASVLITGNLGPKAQRVLVAANIKAYMASQGTVEQALADYQQQRLSQI